MTGRWRAERDFGKVVGIAFMVLGAWFIWRGRFPMAGRAALGVGATLLVAGLLAPRVLVYPNRAWMALAEALSWVMTRVILGVLFLVAVTPIGLIRRLTGANPLQRRGAPRESYWMPYPARHNDRSHFEKMY